MKTGQYTFFSRIIATWPRRIKQSKKKQSEIAVLSGVHPEHFSRIVNKHIVNTRVSTISKVEDVLDSLGAGL